MLLLLLSVVILAFFLLFDGWYFIRYFVGIHLRRWPRARNLKFEQVLKPIVTRHIVLPSDIDVFMHMNNSKYLRESDFGRINHLFQLGLLRSMVDLKIVIVAVSINIRYRRELRLFQTFNIETKIVYWDERNVYMEQRFVRKGFVHAVSYVQARFIGGTPRQLIASCDVPDLPETPPPPSDELKAVIAFNDASSKTLRPEK